MTNLLLEQYLEQVSAKLKVLPEAGQEQQIAEIRQHLETLITGGVAQGENEENATKDAIRQFDAEDRLGADLQRAGLRGRLGRMPDFAVAVLCCFAVYALILPVYRLLEKPLVLGLARLQVGSSSSPIQNLVFGHSVFSSSIFWIGLLCGAVLIAGLGRKRMLQMIRSQPIVQEALIWSLMTGAGQFLVYCWMLSRYHGKHSVWENIAYVILPTAFALLRPVRTRAGFGVAAAILPAVLGIMLSSASLLPYVLVADSVNWNVLVLSPLKPLFLLCAPLLLITLFRLHLEPGPQGFGSTKIVLR